MEKQQTIDQYILANTNGTIDRKAQSPLIGILMLVVGVAMFVLMHRGGMADSLQAFLLFGGVVLVAVGLILGAMSLTRALWHYRYLPTHSSMKDRQVYFGADEYSQVVDALAAGHATAIANLPRQTSTNASLRIVYSRDWAIALLQAGRHDTGHFEPETPVTVLTGADAAALQRLVR